MATDPSTRIDEEKQAFWIRILERWESGGKTVRSYCAGHGLKETQFYWWKRELQARGRWKPGQSGKRPKHTAGTPSIPFAEVHLKESASPEISEARLEVCVGDRFRVRIAEGFDPQTLERLLSVLEGRGC